MSELSRPRPYLVWGAVLVAAAVVVVLALVPSGAWVALHDLFTEMDERRVLRAWPLETQLGAVSVGVVDSEPVCDQSQFPSKQQGP